MPLSVSYSLVPLFIATLLYLLNCAGALDGSQQVKCGHIDVPQLYRISSWDDTQLHDVSIDVLDSGEVYCTCNVEQELPTSRKQLSVSLQTIQGSEIYHISLSFVSPCQIVGCRQKEFKLAALQVPSSAAVKLRLGRDSAECNKDDMFEKSYFNIGWDSLTVDESAFHDCVRNLDSSNEVSQIQIVSTYSIPKEAASIDTANINFTQLIPFDLESCFNTDPNPSLIQSQLVPRPLKGRTLHHAKLEQRVENYPKNSKTVDHNNDIHDLSARRRWLRQANSQPMFDQLHYTSTVRENSDVGTVVDTITAIDTDQGRNGELMYTMTPDNLFSQNLFAINSSSGTIRTTGIIDRERKAEHSFRLMATDGGGLSQIASYMITVEDENDNVPTFQEGTYFNKTIPESTQASSTVLEVTVIDEDTGNNGIVDYHLVNNTDNKFDVSAHGNQVMLVLRQQLDYESRTFYRLTLIATDRGTPQQSSQSTVEIHVQDEADSRPVFNASSYSISINESTSPSAYLLTVLASSADSPNLVSIEYFVTSGDPTGRFHLGGNTGVLTLQQAVDFEMNVLYTLTVRAQSTINPTLHADVTVSIRIINVNDHAPRFTRSAYSVSVLETDLTNQLIETVVAEDSDDGELGEVTYGYQEGTDFGVVATFDLNPTSGKIVSRTPLDREEREVYSFTVVARDGGIPPRSSSVMVTISVTDVNDEPPVFSQPEYYASVEEGGDEVTTVTRVMATDSDSDSGISYFIASGDTHNAFSIGSSDGVIVTQVVLDREEKASYQLEVGATDGRVETTVSVYINVTDINDEYPSFSRSLYSLPSVSELLDVNSEVLRVTATDRDEGSNSQVTYSSTDINNKFVLDSDTGVIRLVGSLDYETRTAYSFTVTGTDGGATPLFTTARVEILIQDENDNSPVFDPYDPVASVEENQPAQTSIIQLRATDADSGSNALITYDIIGDSRAVQAFGVSPSGLVYTLHSLDREVASQYQVQVQAADGGEVPLTQTVTLTVNILDVIDYPPVFTQISYSALITTETPKDSSLVIVRASTRDNVPANKIIYRITSGGNSTLFRIDQDTGYIRAMSNINPTTHMGVYTMQVTAQLQHLSESVPVIITIMRDDGIPRLHPLTLYFNSLETEMEATNYLGAVRITQPKNGANYTFSLEASPAIVQRYFRIATSRTMGELSVLRGVVSGHYRLNVSVSTSAGTGYGAVDAYIHVLKNESLENGVIATFGGVREASFMSLRLEQFAYSLTQIIPCSRDQVQIYGIQTTGAESDETVSVAFAVLQPDLQSYISQESLLYILQSNITSVRPSMLLRFGSDVCVSEPCANLQRCTPVVELYRHSPVSHLRTIMANNRIFLSHSFSQSHSCSCPQGFSLDDLCTSEINECDPSPCLFRAQCTDLLGDYHCECPLGFSGKNCSIVCPSPSCQPCSPNPCHHGADCSIPIQDPSSFICEACPWPNGYHGDRCELTTLHFTTGSFISFPTLGSLASVRMSLQFATVAPKGLLLYNGRIGGNHDYIAVELVIGQLSVGVSLGGVATTLRTESIWNLNDGEWHTVDLELRDGMLSVNVSGCSQGSEFLAGAVESCRLEGELADSTNNRILDLTTPLYIGGLEVFMSSLSGTVSSTSFQGCIANVEVGGRLLDFASPLGGHGTEVGCSPLEASCDQAPQCGGREECVRVWNGTVCSCEGSDPSCSQGSVQLDSGYLKIVQTTGPIRVSIFEIDLRTHTSNAVLAQFGSHASLELRQGTVIYRRRHDSSLSYTALTLAADGFISDGLWHHVRLELSQTRTRISIDNDRIISSQPEDGVIQVTSITLGAEDSSSSSQFSGCLKSMIINQLTFTLANILRDGRTHFNVSNEGVESGCNHGNPCANARCPDNSVCDAGWQEYSCECHGGYRVTENQCRNPCNPSPCLNEGTCIPLPLSSSAAFQCTCSHLYRGPTCEGIVGQSCPVGQFTPPTSQTTSCQHCPCDPGGVAEGVCDSANGECICKSGLDVFSASGDLGCKSCDCHMLGSVSSECNTDTGQCQCKESVVGRRCDQCAERFAGLDELGCVAATVVYGEFSLSTLTYQREMADRSSPHFIQLAQGLQRELEREMFGYGLPGLFEVTVRELGNSSGLVQVDYRLANYLPRGSSDLVPRPPEYTLISVVQTIVQTGWVGPYQTNTSSHSVQISCSQVPAVCEGCPEGTTKDDVICRLTTPPGCHGDDTDRDGIPNSCDVCPYYFNPDQDPHVCAVREGVCPGGVASGVLWSPTSPGVADKKPCPTPLTGYATRACLEGGVWGNLDNNTCLSISGQNLLIQAQALEGGQLLNLDQLVSAVGELRETVRQGGGVMYGGDVHTSGRLLEQYVQLLLRYVRSWREDGRTTTILESITNTASSLLSSKLATQWRGVVKGVGFEADNFLSTIETLMSVVPGVNQMSSNSLVRENLVIKSRDFSSSDDSEMIEIMMTGKSAYVSLPEELATPTSHVAMAMVANLGEWLPERYTFEVDDVIVATPLLSVQVIDEGQIADVQDLATPINITIPFKMLFESTEHLQDQDVACVSWEYGASGGWSPDGCNFTGLNHTHCSCQCSHLTVFTVLLPSNAYQIADDCPGDKGCYHPAIFTYIVLSAVVVLLLISLLILTCLRGLQDLHNTVHKNLLAALMLTTAVFIAGIDRTEIEAVCGLFGVLLFYFLTASLSWMVADALIIGRYLMSPPPKPNFIVYLIIIGWILPLLLCGIPTGAVGIIKSPFIEAFGGLNYCWLHVDVVYAFVAPAAILLVLYVIGIIFSLVTLSKMNKATSDTTAAGVAMNKHKVIVALCVSMATVALFVVTWSFGLASVYNHASQYLDYPFAIFQATFAAFLFIVLCLNSKVKSAFLATVRRKDDIDASLQNTINTSSTGHGFYAEIPANQKRYNAQQQGFHNQISLLAMQQDGSPHSSSTHHFEEKDAPLMRIARLPSHPPPPPITPSHPTPHSVTPSLPPPRTQSQTSVAAAQQPWFAVPDPTPLSPLTYGSDADSEMTESHDHSKVSRDHSTVSHDKSSSLAGAAAVVGGVKSHDNNEKSHDEQEGPFPHHKYAQISKKKNNSSKVSRDSEEDTPPSLPPRQLTESERGGVSPSLTELYQRARGSRSLSPEEYLDYPKGSTPLESPRGQLEKTGGGEDPLWYCQRDSLPLDKPNPYETAVVTPSTLHLATRGGVSSPAASDLPPSLKQTKKIHRNSNTSFGSSKHSSSHSQLGSSLSASNSAASSPSSARFVQDKGPPVIPVLQDTYRSSPLGKKLSHPTIGFSNPMHAPSPPLEARGSGGSSSPAKKRMLRTESDAVLRPVHTPVHRISSDNTYRAPPTSHVSSGLGSSLQAQVGRGQRSRKRSGATPEGSLDSYHSNGPSVEGKLNQIIRHADGSETHQSLV